MDNKLKKLVSMVSAAAISAVSMTSVVPVTAADTEATAFPYVIEGEDMEGAELWTSIYQTEVPGYSGKGFAYITGGAMSFTVNAPADGMYSIVVKGAEYSMRTAKNRDVLKPSR